MVLSKGKIIYFVSIFIIGLGLLFLKPCKHEVSVNPDKQGRSIQAETLSAWIIQGSEHYTLFDLDRNESIKDGLDPYATSTSVDDLLSPSSLRGLSKSKIYVILATNEDLAHRAVLTMEQKGFSAYRLQGGRTAWMNEVINPPALTNANADIDEVHRYNKKKAVGDYLMGRKIETAAASGATGTAGAPPPSSPTPSAKKIERVKSKAESRGC